MTNRSGPVDRKEDAGSQNYALFCLVALLVILLALLPRGHTLWTLVLVLVSAAAVMFHWRSAPMLLLLGLVLLLAYDWWTGRLFWAAVPSNPVSDLLLSAGVLGFVAANHRLQGLSHHLVPPDSSRRETGGNPSSKKAHRRSEGLVSSREMALLLLSLPGWAAVGQLAWLLLPQTWATLGIDPRAWRAILLVWLLGIGLFMIANVFGYLYRRRALLAEATLPLQELLWQETRREQRIINRWLAWARARRRRRA